MVEADEDVDVEEVGDLAVADPTNDPMIETPMATALVVVTELPTTTAPPMGYPAQDLPT